MNKRYITLIILMGSVILLMGFYIVKINLNSNMEATEENKEETKEDNKKEIYKGIPLADDEEVSLISDGYESLDPRDDIKKITEFNEDGIPIQTDGLEGIIRGGSYLDPHGTDYQDKDSDGNHTVDELTVLMDTELLMTNELNRFTVYDHVYIDVYDNLTIEKIDNLIYRISGMAFHDDEEQIGKFDIELRYDFGRDDTWIDYKWTIIEREEY